MSDDPIADLSPEGPPGGAGDSGWQTVCRSLLRSLVAHQGGMLALKDGADGRYLYVDATMAAFLGRTPEAVVGLTDAQLFDGATALMLRAADQAALAQSEAMTTQHRVERDQARHEFSVLRAAGPVEGSGRQLLGCAWFDVGAERQREQRLRIALEQLEQQQRANEELRRELSEHEVGDRRTGLYTRAHFEDQLRREVDLSTREHREFALVLIEVDPLDPGAAAFGDDAVQRVIDAMSRLLRGNTRAMDASCRLGAMRFAVLLSGVGLATAHSRMEGLRRQCATQIVAHQGRELGFTASMGVASFPHTAHTQEDLVAASEQALAEAQRRGGNHVTLASIRFEPG